jgi:hypothetical protein
MTIELLLIIIGLCLAACFLVFKWQESVVDLAVPPYQEPVKPDMAEQWVATNKESLDNIDTWNAKIGDKIWYKPDSGPLTAAQVAQIKDTVEPTPLNPQAAWPFPVGRQP